MARLTDVPGSSDYVDRGVVVYSHESKTDLLGVPASQIAEHGAVSESVAQAMAVGMARVSGADFALGITGIAGPSGGTPEKPVGVVVISAARARGGAVETRVRTFNFVGGRDLIRFQASQAALDMVRRWITEEAPAAL
jgi:nicotinamide-nucleotide amidase